jgi:hypothetical protein
VTDKQIQDALWHYYYDVEKSVAYILNTYMEKPKAQKKENEKGKGKKVQGGFVYFLFVLVVLENMVWRRGRGSLGAWHFVQSGYEGLRDSC